MTTETTARNRAETVRGGFVRFGVPTHAATRVTFLDGTLYTSCGRALGSSREHRHGTAVKRGGAVERGGAPHRSAEASWFEPAKEDLCAREKCKTI